MKVENNTFDLHEAIIGPENQFVVVLREDILHRFYCRSRYMYTKQDKFVEFISPDEGLFIGLDKQNFWT